MTGQVTADDSLKEQLAALLHAEHIDCDVDCAGPHVETAARVLSWLLTLGETRTAYDEQSTVNRPVLLSSQSQIDFAREHGIPLVQRRVVSVCSVWTTVEGNES